MVAPFPAARCTLKVVRSVNIRWVPARSCVAAAHLDCGDGERHGDPGHHDGEPDPRVEHGGAASGAGRPIVTEVDRAALAQGVPPLTAAGWCASPRARRSAAPIARRSCPVNSRSWRGSWQVATMDAGQDRGNCSPKGR